MLTMSNAAAIAKNRADRIRRHLAAEVTEQLVRDRADLVALLPSARDEHECVFVIAEQGEDGPTHSVNVALWPEPGADLLFDTPVADCPDRAEAIARAIELAA